MSPGKWIALVIFVGGLLLIAFGVYSSHHEADRYAKCVADGYPSGVCDR